ncbi:outer membrane efflux protein [Mucilaginibacter paludis DSM 18603]|uniref:Outer membrane efflux protein n=2 Tax=Mucilaginibacter TaxID=423349 RepID=H1YAM3_9SPHI|nr:outer membrane efflux protein [Mucilaginibacter paludis DSM 18603]
MLLTASLIGFALTARCQTDTLHLDFKQAEGLFLKNNLSLLAQKYNVEATQALIQQAKLWDNPTLSTDQNIHDGNGKFFDHSNGNGQLYAQLTQLFKTAGKRGKEIQVAKDDAQIQQAEFNDLLRNLHYNLLLDFAQLSNLIEQSKIYTGEISSVNNLISGVSKSYDVGNSSLKDVIRLKALLYGLENDLVENSRQLNDLQSQLKTLLATSQNAYIVPQMETRISDQPLDANALIEKAKANRGDYLSNQYQYNQAGHKLALQKALAVPDVTVGVEYDQHSSYAPNYVGLTVGLPLPLFNRNQGNIKSAKSTIQSLQATYKNSEMQLNNDVVSAIQQYHLSTQLLSKNETDFYQQYDNLFNNMFKAYKQRQLSLVEFIDFFDSYKDTKLKVINQQYNLQKAIADLNFSVGATVINP